MKIQEALKRLTALAETGETDVGIIWLDRNLAAERGLIEEFSIKGDDWATVCEAMDESDSSEMYDAMVDAMQEIYYNASALETMDVAGTTYVIAHDADEFAELKSLICGEVEIHGIKPDLSAVVLSGETEVEEFLSNGFVVGCLKSVLDEEE